MNKYVYTLIMREGFNLLKSSIRNYDIYLEFIFSSKGQVVRNFCHLVGHGSVHLTDLLI